MRIGKAGIDTRRLYETGLGFGMTIKLLQNNATIIVRWGKIRPNFDRPVETGQSLLPALQFDQQRAFVATSFDTLRVAAQRRIETLQRLGVPTQSNKRIALKIMRHGNRGIQPDRFIDDRQRVACPPLPQLGISPNDQHLQIVRIALMEPSVNSNGFVDLTAKMPGKRLLEKPIGIHETMVDHDTQPSSNMLKKTATRR